MPLLARACLGGGGVRGPFGGKGAGVVPSRLREDAGWCFRGCMGVRLFEEGILHLWMGGLAGMHQKGRGPEGARRRLDGWLEEVAEAVGGGYCRLHWSWHLASGGQWLGIGWAPWNGGWGALFGGQEVWSPNVCAPNMAQVNISFCKFYCLRQGTSKRGRTSANHSVSQASRQASPPPPPRVQTTLQVTRRWQARHVGGRLTPAGGGRGGGVNPPWTPPL